MKGRKKRRTRQNRKKTTGGESPTTGLEIENNRPEIEQVEVKKEMKI